ncbi:hypothetical protein FB45DRAFT_865735 [Roridomyces roridus]|uniref:Uncharacterized protein n=1 Tax=Roridomyces roridus TaxID=1738132 RepID=A0AAD7FRL7_9AGAR|nr:hypothetical protein FB45DRAFT_865735 [Roridomyces roridus]
MKLTYASGEVPLGKPLVITYTAEDGDPPFFIFQALQNGILKQDGLPGPVSNSGAFTVAPGVAGTHVIEAFATSFDGQSDLTIMKQPRGRRRCTICHRPNFYRRYISQAGVVSTSFSQPGSVTTLYGLYTNGSSTIIVEEGTSAPSPMASASENATKAPKQVDKAAFAGAGIGAAIVLAVLFVILLVRRRTKRQLRTAMLDGSFTERPNSPTPIV